MLEPYATPASDTDEVTPRAYWELPILCLGLGVAWWIALLIPEATRGFLLRNDSLEDPIISLDRLPANISPLTLAWGFVRVVAIVAGACGLFARLHRPFRKFRYLTALACLWGGSGLFAVTTASLSFESIMVGLISPALFIVFAWYVAIPMTVLTALLLTNRLDDGR